MSRAVKIFATLVFIASQLFAPLLYAADTAIAYFNISGTVPTYFSVTTRCLPGDLDLTPNVIVNDRRIGLLHFKYNVSLASLTISSDTASGGPESTSGAIYNFQGAGFGVSFDAGCTTVDPTYNSPFILSNAGTDVKSANAAGLTTTGVEEDCEVFASWVGTSSVLPLAGVYALSLTITMVSL